MRIYRYVWLTVACPVAVFGGSVALVGLPPLALMALGICAGLLGALVAMFAAGCSAPVNLSMRQCLRSVFVAAGIAGVLAGLTLLLGGAGVGVMVLLAAVSPPAVQWLVGSLPHRQDHSSPGTVTAGPSPAQAGTTTVAWGAGSGFSPAPGLPVLAALRPAAFPPLGTLTSAELCAAWRVTYSAMRKTCDLAGWERLVERRRALLDELERRHPVGFARWMDDGARAGSDPSRYVAPPGRRCP